MNESLLQPIGGVPLVIWILGLLVVGLFVARCQKVRISFKSKQREILFETERTPDRPPSPRKPSANVEPS